MKELQKLLKRFLAREIGLDDLRGGFALLLEDDADLAASAAAWLDTGEKDGRLSATVCTSLKNVLVSHMAAANVGPDPRESGIFDSLEEYRDKATLQRPDQSESKEPFEFEIQSTALAADTIVESPEAQLEQEYERQAEQVGAILEVGSLISERYELLSQLGSGGMGRVFRARDRLRAEAQDRNPYVALKVLSEEFKAHPDAMIALQREARRAQTLAHPNVITVHEFFRDGPHFYITMELLHGKPLDELLKTDYFGGSPLDKVWPIIEGVGHGLSYGHEKGIVHSDVKPANIFVCDDGTVKVLDLGISRPMPVADMPDTEQTVFDPAERLGSLTPAFASLEMWHQDAPDPRDDVYALACVSYMLLTGRHPFSKQSAKKAYEEQMSPERVESISRGQWSALSGGLKLLRSDRIKSVNRFLALLDPQSVVRSHRRTAILLAALTAVAVAPVGVRYYGRVVETKAMDDRGRMQLPAPMPAAGRSVLTPEQQIEIESFMSLAGMQFESINDQSSVNDLTYLLSSGPNNVIQLADAVLEIDPGYEAALELRRRVFDLYLTRARQLRDEKEYEMAMSLARNAEAVIPNTSTVLRLQRRICDRAPALCVRQ